VRLNGSAVHFDQMFDDGKPKSKPAELSPRAAVGLAEAVKDVGQKIRADALPVITHRKQQVGPVASGRYADGSTLGRELDRIGNQVPNDLLHASEIAECAAG